MHIEQVTGVTFGEDSKKDLTLVCTEGLNLFYVARRKSLYVACVI